MVKRRRPAGRLFFRADFKAWLQQHWPSVRTALLAGDYMPMAILQLVSLLGTRQRFQIVQ
jgi:hypothetical protein